MNTVIGLLRHGQTDWNVDMRLQGISDIPLNDFGRQQAVVAAEVLKTQGWQSIISSPLSRAFETAQIVGSAMGLEDIKIQQLLLERSFGVAEGMTYDQWKLDFTHGHNAEDSETISELDARVLRLLEELAQSCAGTRTLTVSHGALIRRIIHIVSNGEFPRDGERFGNASLTVIAHDVSGWQIVDYNPNPVS